MSAFEGLLRELAKLEPHTGWVAADQIRTLTDAEVGYCLEEYPEMLFDLPEGCLKDYAALIARELRRESSPASRAQEVGFIIRNRLEELCREWVLADLCHRSLSEESLMLVLARKLDEEIVIRCRGEVIIVKMLGYDSSSGVRLGIEASRQVEINRAEIDARKQAEKEGIS